MKKLAEIIKYGDSEPLELTLSILIIAQLCHPSPSIFCWHMYIPDYYYVLGIISSVGMLYGNIINNISIRKWSSNVSLVLVLGVFVISLYKGTSNLQIYLIFLSEIVALFWITWRCSREEVLKSVKTLKSNKTNE
jgi:hypothetical protein